MAEKAGAWEQAMAGRGEHVRPAFEDALSGFEMILDRATGRQPVTETFIRELHATMLRSQNTHTVYVSINGVLTPQEQPLARGEYKKHANSPTRPDGTVHAYAPVEDTAPEMARLIGELRTEEFQSAPSVAQAAYAHYAFVCIHPFADGNGRVARALASVYLYRSPGVPLVVYQDQRTNYIDALEAADQGRPNALLRFFAERVTDTINLIEEELTLPSEQNSLDELSRLLESNHIPEAVMDAMGRFRELLHAALASRVDEKATMLGLPFDALTTLIGETPSVPEGYKPISDTLATSLVVIAKTPIEISVFWPVALYAKSSDLAEFDLIAVTGSGRRLGIYLREIVPTVSEILRQRVGFFADAVVSEFLELVTAAARKAAK